MKKIRKNQSNESVAVGMTGLLMLLIAAGCSGDIPGTSPPAPKMVPFVNDPFAETGIRPTPDAIADSGGAGGILVEWNRIDPTKVSGGRIGGYYLYRSRNLKAHEVEDSPTFVRIQKIEVSPARDDTLFIDKDVEVGYIYSYYVTSFNNADDSQESVPSDTVHYQPTIRPFPTEPRGTIPAPPDGIVRFRFGPANQLGGRSMAIEVNEVELLNEGILRRRMWRSAQETVDYNDSYIDYKGDLPLIPGRYRWRVINYFPFIPVAGRVNPPSGNTSKWEAFTIK